MLAIVDYGAGNLQSVQKALDFIGAPAEITADAAKIRRAAGVVLPGVGAFGDAMESMRRRDLAELVREAADGTRPFLGICLGQQLLFASSEESPGVTGLAALPGQVLRIPGGNDASGVPRKVPHMGWNSLHLLHGDGIFAGVPEDAYVYFVHSFYVKAAEEDCVAARASYGVEMDVAVRKGLLTATQFHPEKSGEVGLLMLRNFWRLCA
ncbi:MAG: imidazole glycerol phosphate synthase subunit HisH [Oscillospiraceae bacterium]|jgi:glutamine amidotransferase|nr:imidazole glycerol phosphate synthase subunit HisH [Oscillospiraceae bacterium]